MRYGIKNTPPPLKTLSTPQQSSNYTRAMSLPSHACLRSHVRDSEKTHKYNHFNFIALEMYLKLRYPTLFTSTRIAKPSKLYDFRDLQDEYVYTITIE